MHEVTFDKCGFVVLPVYIRHKDKPVMLNSDYKVDSGANCTTVSAKRLIELGYTKDWIISGKLLAGNARPTVASGLHIEDCYEVILPEIRIGDWVGYNWPFMTSLSVPFRFLLGTDTMQFFNWNFDYENGLCKFKLIPSKRKLLFNQKEQSIHAINKASKGKFPKSDNTNE